MHGSRTVIEAQRPSKPDHRVGSEGSMRQQSRPVAIRLRLIHCIKLEHCLKGSMKNRKKIRLENSIQCSPFLRGSMHKKGNDYEWMPRLQRP